MARIVLAEDHPIVREGVRSFISKLPTHSVVAECRTGLETLRTLEQTPADVLIADLRLPELDGLEVIRRARRGYPGLRILVLSMHSGAPFVVRALRNGANGYLLKNSNLGEMSTALDVILGNGMYLSADVARHMNVQNLPYDPYDELTKREREILQLVAEGNSASQIKDRLAISVRTVEKHRSNLMIKLRLGGHAEVIRYALQRGLIPLSSPSAA